MIHTLDKQKSPYRPSSPGSPHVEGKMDDMDDLDLMDDLDWSILVHEPYVSSSCGSYTCG